MPFSVFFEGKSANILRYPGMKRIMGKAMMIRKVSLISSKIRKSPMILQTKHKRIVLGYLSESIRIVWDYILTRFNILFITKAIKTMKRTKMTMFIRTLSDVGM